MIALRSVKWLALAALLSLLAALPFMLDSFYINLATQALYLGLFALSINLIAGYGGMVTLGQAGISGMAAYALGIAVTRADVPLGIALVLALVVAAFAAFVFGVLAVRASGVYFLMITLAEGMIVWGIAQRWTTVTGGDNGLTGIDRPIFAAEYWTYYYLTLGVVLVCTLVIFTIVRSPFGLSLKGIRESEGRMGPLGYNVALHKLVAFTISGTFAGISGLLLAMYNSFFSPASVHLEASADGLLMSILGGMGTLPGAFVGSTIYVFVTNYVSGFLDRWPTLLGGIFVLTILFAQDGIVGAWSRRVWAPLVRRAEGDASARERLSGPLPGAKDGEAHGATTGRDGDAEDLERPTMTKSKGDHESETTPPAEIVLCACITLAGVLAAACRSPEESSGAGSEGPIRMALLSPTTGVVAAAGTDMLNGWRLYWKVNGDEVAGRKVEWIHEERTGLSRVTRAQAGELGHGEQRQLELALALAADPKVLLLDEPGAGLAAGERHVMRELVSRLPDDMTVLLVEHDMELALGLADYVVCMHNGGAVAEGTPEDIKANEKVQEIYLGKSGA